MATRLRLCKALALATVVVLFPALNGPLMAQKKNWVGETVLHTKPPKDIRFVDRVGEKEQKYSFSGIWPFQVRDERDGWLRIHDRRNEGWVNKADFVLAREAIAYFTRRIEANPKDAFAVNMRGASWLQQKDFDKAIVDFDAALAINANDAGAYNNRGVAWKDKKEYDKAIADFTHAIRINPKNAVSFVNRGVAWRAKNEYDKAIADYDETIRLDQRYALAYYHRGIALT